MPAVCVQRIAAKKMRALLVETTTQSNRKAPRMLVLRTKMKIRKDLEITGAAAHKHLSIYGNV
jgi:hypothetical protein